MQTKLCVLLFDSILNSVFYHQVFEPLKEKAIANADGVFIILSFEKNLETAIQFLKNDYIKTGPKNLKIILKQRLPFWGTWTLYLLKKSLVDLLENYNFNNIFCRGIFAAKILQFGIKDIYEKTEFNQIICKNFKKPNLNIQEITISIPGLADQEALMFDERNLSFFKKLLIKLKRNIQSNLIQIMEESFFSNLSKMNDYINPFKITFLPCSKALQKYFMDKYKLEKSNFSEVLAFKKKIINQAQKLQQRKLIRKLLNITDNIDLYCYLGGLQSWQNFELSVEYFLKIMKINPESHFLVICKEQEKAIKILDEYFIPKEKITVISLEPRQVHNYLLACDYGFLLRNANLVNWTSRPIKAIEYLGAGLKIIHNNTIEWVIENY